MSIGNSKPQSFEADTASHSTTVAGRSTKQRTNCESSLTSLKARQTYGRAVAAMPNGVVLVARPAPRQNAVLATLSPGAKVPSVFSISVSGILEMFCCVGAAARARTFPASPPNAPAIIFYDDLETRSAGAAASVPMPGSTTKRTTLNHLLVGSTLSTHVRGSSIPGSH